MMRPLLILALAAVALFVSVDGACAQAAGQNLNITLNTGAPTGGETLSMPLQLLFIFTVLSLVPAILMMTTSFVRIAIVFSFLRTALTLQQPSNQVLIALALFLTFYIMGPTVQNINERALTPLRDGQITFEQAAERAAAESKTFMLRFAREKELNMFMEMSATPLVVEKAEDLPLTVVLPAFMLSELKTGFQMGLMILLPFLVIDMVVSSILMALGMMMLPPPIVALPLKIMIFVLVDGWSLIVRSLVASFQI